MRFKPNVLLQIQTPPLDDDFEGTPSDWETIKTEWFELKPLQAMEREQAAQMQSTTSHVATCFWFPGTNTRMRLKHGDRIFNVASVVNVDEANRKLEWRLVEIGA